jgi:hypothetical protein
MKMILDVKDNKSAFILELLNNFSFVKAKPITPEKAILLEEIKEAVDNVQQAKGNKIKSKPIAELLDEL